MKYYVLLLTFISTTIYAQDLSPQNGVTTSFSTFYILKNATILVSPLKTIKNGSILIKNSEIIEVGTSVSAPKEAIVIDCGGKTIVPSFIETYSSAGMPETPAPTGRRRGGANELLSSKKGAYYWNESIHPEVDASSLFQINENANTELLKIKNQS